MLETGQWRYPLTFIVLTQNQMTRRRLNSDTIFIYGYTIPLKAYFRWSLVDVWNSILEIWNYTKSFQKATCVHGTLSSGKTICYFLELIYLQTLLRIWLVPFSRKSLNECTKRRWLTVALCMQLFSTRHQSNSSSHLQQNGPFHH